MLGSGVWFLLFYRREQRKRRRWIERLLSSTTRVVNLRSLRFLLFTITSVVTSYEIFCRRRLAGATYDAWLWRLVFAFLQEGTEETEKMDREVAVVDDSRRESPFPPLSPVHNYFRCNFLRNILLRTTRWSNVRCLALAIGFCFSTGGNRGNGEGGSRGCCRRRFAS
jgi:hypothetical protein